MSKAAKATNVKSDSEVEMESSPGDEIEGQREIGNAELKAIAEAMIFVADEPVSARTIADVIKVDREIIDVKMFRGRRLRRRLCRLSLHIRHRRIGGIRTGLSVAGRRRPILQRSDSPDFFNRR